MYIELFSVDRAGIFIDLDEWGLGFELSRNLDGLYDGTGTLLLIHILCLHIDIALFRKNRPQIIKR